MKSNLLVLALAALVSPFCAAQTNRSPQAAAGLASPIIETDRKVTFRVRAPGARKVSLTSDFSDETQLLRDEQGVWSVKMGPITPDIYFYSFLIDGVRAVDPGNPNVKIGFTTSTVTSILEVRGDQPAFYDIKNVPHGTLRTHLYHSKSSGIIREVNVYTPPGYDENSGKRYPVLYLLHGANNDHHSWQRYGSANEILDNLLAEKAIEPFLVVMPLGYGGASADGVSRGPSGPSGGGGDLYERDVIEDVIPFIDKTYRSISNREQRAIIGFSMGGGQSARIGLGHLDTFSHIGVMSAGLGGGTNAPLIAKLAADPAAANKLLKLLWIACGKDDFAMPGARTFSESLGKTGIKHTFLETEGAHHWRVWRRYLRDVSPLLFRPTGVPEVESSPRSK
jgi:enterochelin esterase-like enzyme